jgi:hypothetical protein
MNTAEIKVRLHEEIEHSDVKLLKMLYALITEYRNEPELLEDKRKALILEERKKYLRGEGKSYSWEDVKNIALNKNRRNEL